MIVFARDLNDGCCGKDRRVVDQYVDVAKRADGLGDGGVDAVLPGDVHLYGKGRIANPRGAFARALDVNVSDRNAGALAHVGLGECKSDAACRPRDQSRLAIEPFHVMRRPWASNRWN